MNDSVTNSVSDSLGEGKGREEEGNAVVNVGAHPSETTYVDSAITTARRAVAHAVRHVRRWDEPGILAAFDTAAKRGHSFAAIAACLFDIAADPSAKTPGVLVTRLANGWRREVENPTQIPKLERCAKCHIAHRPETPCAGPGITDGPGYSEYTAAKEAL